MTTITTTELVNKWIEATQQLESQKSLLTKLEYNLANVRNALGIAMDPGDMVDGESNTCLIRINDRQERLLIIKKKGFHNYELVWRTKPREGKTVEGGKK